jgi:microcystin-dependent protein
MGTPFIGEIRLVGFNFAPQGWAFCDGATMSIVDNQVLYILIGTTYGGDGVNTFNLPDLRGRVPVHQGSGFVIGQAAGTESVTLNANQLPSHNHALQGSTDGGTSIDPTGNVLATTSTTKVYSTPTSVTPMTSTTTASGGGQPHENMQPFLAASYIIALFGVFPSQN